MTFQLTDQEWTLLSRLPDDEVIQLAAELDILVPAELDARELLSMCVPRMVDRARATGLPLSQYDREDIEALTQPQIHALHKLLGLWGRATANGLLRAGAKAYRVRKKTRPGNDPYAYMIPILLGPIVRCVMES